MGIGSLRSHRLPHGTTSHIHQPLSEIPKPVFKNLKINNIIFQIDQIEATEEDEKTKAEEKSFKIPNDEGKS